MNSSEVSAAATPRWRSIISTTLLVILFLVAASANLAVWLQTTLNDSDVFVDALAPLPEDKSVAEALGQSIADAAVDPQQTAADVSARLPENFQDLAVPIATELNELAADVATRLFETDTFEAVWERTVRAAHAVLLDLLDLRQGVKTLVVDVEEAASSLSDELQSAGITITVPDTPSLTVVGAGQYSAVVNTIRFIYTTGWLFPVVFVVFAVALFFVVVDRRRAALWLGGVTATAMAFDLILMRIVRADLSARASDSLTSDAVRSAWDTVTSRLHWQTWIVLVLALIVMAVARYAGDSTGTRSLFDDYPTPAAAAFLERWGAVLQAVTVVLALLMLLLIPTITFGLALLIFVMAAAVVLFIRLGKKRAEVGSMV